MRSWLCSAAIAEVGLEPVALPFTGSLRFSMLSPELAHKGRDRRRQRDLILQYLAGLHGVPQDPGFAGGPARGRRNHLPPLRPLRWMRVMMGPSSNPNG